MKKVFCLTLIAVLILLTSACGASVTSKNYAELAVKEVLNNTVPEFTYEIQDVYVKKNKTPVSYSSDPNGLGTVLFSYDDTVCRAFVKYTAEGVPIESCVFIDKAGNAEDVLRMNESTIRNMIGSTEEVQKSDYGEAIINTYVRGYQSLYANSFPSESELVDWERFSGDLF